MLTTIDRLRVERIRSAKAITIIVDEGTAEQMILRVDSTKGHDIRVIRGNIRLAFQDYFNNTPKDAYARR